MKTIIRNSIVEAIILILCIVQLIGQIAALIKLSQLGMHLRLSAYPAMLRPMIPVLAPTLAIGGVMLAFIIMNIIKLRHGPLAGAGTVRLTDDTDEFDKPVHGRRVDIDGGGHVEVRWNSSKPVDERLLALDSGTRVRISWYPRRLGAILVDVRPLEAARPLDSQPAAAHPSAAQSTATPTAPQRSM